MISKEELERYKRIVKLNLGQAEIAYFQSVVLFILYKSIGRELIFKGGTALNKCYGLDRFSKDLDFTLSNKIIKEDKEIQKIEAQKFKEILIKGLTDFLIDFELEEKLYKNGFRFIIRIKGPLYTGNRFSLCRLELDISLREKIILEPEIRRIGRFLEELPIFDVVVMKEEEILAEKIRAIITRNYARDLYDLWFLIENEVPINTDFINKKLSFYNETFNSKIFKKCIEKKKTIWKEELTPLLPRIIDFNKVKKIILSKF